MNNKSEELERSRREKDEYFRQSHDSPIPHQERADFRGLSYFPFDPTYVVKATFHRYPEQRIVKVGTSTGVLREYVQYGYFEFNLDNSMNRLEAYKSAHSHGHEESLFIPFRDATSGRETYGAARYLDIPESEGEEAEIDFNLAYNPYCAYNSAYTCPLPPRENWLKIAVKAGEMNYSASH